MNIIEVAIEPKMQVDSALLDAALDGLRQNQPGIGIGIDTESGQTILSGETEQQLEEAVTALVRTCQVNVGQPQIAYRETLSRAVTIVYTHKRQIGGGGEFAQVKIEFEPLPPGSGFVFENAVIGGSVREEFIPGVEKSLTSEKEGGLLIGFPVIDFRARLVDGNSHHVDSSARTFEIAARAAFRELAKKGVVKLLEPIMKVEVVAPEDYLGGIIEDLNVRRGHVQGVDARGDEVVISAMVPLSCVLGYSHALRAATDGRGRCTMTYDHYEAVPNWGGDDPNFPGAVGMRVA